jgi:hypothetical protein
MTEYSRWLHIHGILLNREYCEFKNTVMFSTFTVYDKVVLISKMKTRMQNRAGVEMQRKRIDVVL